MDAAILYWSKTGNTEKVALAVEEGLKNGGWRPPKPMDEFLSSKFSEYQKQGRVKLGSPSVPGGNALIFCTYSGLHTGMREAVPAALYAGQFLEHLGFTILDEWYVMSEFHGSEENSTMGRLGDIRGLPSEEDLRRVKNDATRIVKTLGEASQTSSP